MTNRWIGTKTKTWKSFELQLQSSNWNAFEAMLINATWFYFFMFFFPDFQFTPIRVRNHAIETNVWMNEKSIDRPDRVLWLWNALFSWIIFTEHLSSVSVCLRHYCECVVYRLTSSVTSFYCQRRCLEGGVNRENHIFSGQFCSWLGPICPFFRSRRSKFLQMNLNWANKFNCSR